MTEGSQGAATAAHEAAAAASADDGSLRDLLRPILAGRRRQLLTVSATAIGMGLTEAVVLVAVTRIAFSLSQGDDLVSLGAGPVDVTLGVTAALLLTALFVVVRGGFQILNGWQSSSLVVDVLARSRHEMADAFLNSSWSRQSQEQGGRLQELLTTYVSRVSNVVDALAKGITSGFSLASLMVTAIVVSPVAAISLVLALVVLAATLQPLRRIIRGASRGAADTSLGFASGVNEISGLGQEVQVFGVEEPVGERIHGLIGSNAVAMRRQAFLSFMFTPLYASVVLLLLVGALGAIRASGTGNLESLGAVMVVMIRSLAYAQLAQAVYGNLHSNAPYMADLGRQLRTYREDAVVRTGQGLDDIGELVFEGVGFHYVDDAFALEDVTFSIARGEAIGIVGPSGSGKSTLVQLLLRLRAPTAGTISVGGIPLDDIALADWRREVSFVPQDAKLVSGTIADNIAFFRPDIDRATIEAAARAAHVHDDITALPGGYDAEVGGANLALSGGQRQRICIARALLTTPSLVVLDEPTSALDMRSEARVRETLSGLRGRAAVVIIAHRLSTLDSCDRIMVVQDGRIRAFDTPEVLRRSSDFYREVLELSGIQGSDRGPSLDGAATAPGGRGA